MTDKPPDIPDDIWALAAYEGIAYKAKRREIVARAIMAERERCAAIVGLYADHPNEVVGMAADEIFTAIHAAQKSPTP